jgi:hypothetical protein
MLPSLVGQDNFNLFLVNIYLLTLKRAHQFSTTTTTKPFIPKQFGGRLVETQHEPPTKQETKISK